MARYLLSKFAYSVIIVLVMITIVFFAMKSLGDPRPSIIFRNAYYSKEAWDAWGVRLGLDDPVLNQYASWVFGTIKGNYGYSTWQHRPASNVAAEYAPETLRLLLGGIFASVAFSGLTMLLFLSLLGPKLDYAAKALKKIGPAVPVFLLGIFLLLVFTEWTGLTSAIKQQGWDDRLILASVTVGIFIAYGTIRLLIPAVMRVRAEEYNVNSSETRQVKVPLFWARVGKVTLSKLLSYSPVWLLSLLTAIIITEMVFVLPGLGRLVFFAAYLSDIWLAFAAITWLTAAYAAALFASEFVRVIMDPRIRRAAYPEAPAEQ